MISLKKKEARVNQEMVLGDQKMFLVMAHYDRVGIGHEDHCYTWLYHEVNKKIEFDHQQWTHHLKQQEDRFILSTQA